MKLKVWEIALVIAVIAALLGGTALAREQAELSSKLIRLHVVPNSDSEADQALKAAVRDRVLEITQPLLKGVRDRGRAQEVLEAYLEAIKEAAEETVLQHGFNYPVTASLGMESLPTRTYDTFALPAGEYLSLRVTIGEGDGSNWWCVVYPPLCFAAAEGELEAFAGLTDEEVRLITEDTPRYVIKFKAIEIFHKIRAFFKERGIF
jgi:stage II sporulation protein R